MRCEKSKIFDKSSYLLFKFYFIFLQNLNCSLNILIYIFYTIDCQILHMNLLNFVSIEREKVLLFII